MGETKAPILVLRSAVPGRERWQSAALYRRPRQIAAVEEALALAPDVTEARGNSKTGRLLVIYRPALRRARVAELVRQALAVPPLSRSAYRRRQAELANARAEAQDAEDCAALPCCDIDNQSEERLRGYERRLWLGGGVLAGVLVRRLIAGAGGLSGGPIFFAITATTTLVTGWRYVEGAYRSLTGRARVTTDALVGSATVASILLRETVSGLTVIWLLNLGEYLQALTLRRTRRAIRSLLALDDEEVWLIEDGRESRRPITEVQPGFLVAVYAGERITVDGLVESGRATINEAPITGESMPVERGKEGRVFAGTLLLAGQLQIRVESVGDDTAVGRLIQRVEEAQALKPRIQTIGERFAERFVPISFLLAGTVLVLTGDPSRALTMLLIACPCAAGLATPTAVSSSIGNGARRGILIKGGTHLEAAAELDVMVFDKTGTLTEGTPRVQRTVPAHDDYTPDQILALAASAELHSQHPLALAVLERASERDLEIPDHEECEVLAGRGIRATGPDLRLLVGNRRLLEENGVPVSREAVALESQIASEGESIIYVAHQDRLIGQIGVRDRIRPEALTALAGLRDLGVRHQVMLTGDSEEAAESVARLIGLSEWRARLLPDEKFEWIRDIRRRGHRVAMVGDGINDAPALALADVGIAMGTAGSDVAIEAADIALASDDLDHLASTITLSRRTIQLIRQNYAMALGVNSVGVVAGAFGALNPLLAAVLHNLSTILVVLNSTRLIQYDPGRAERPLAPIDDGETVTLLGDEPEISLVLPAEVETSSVAASGAEESVEECCVAGSCEATA